MLVLFVATGLAAVTLVEVLKRTSTLTRAATLVALAIALAYALWIFTSFGFV